MYFGVKIRKELVEYENCIGEKIIGEIIPIEYIELAFKNGEKAIFKNIDDAEEYKDIIEM